MRKYFLVLFLLTACTTFSQQDSLTIRQLFDTELQHGNSYNDLRELCKNIGPRLSGSSQAQLAVNWAYEKLRQYGFENVTLQPVMVTHWERGTKESAWIRLKSGDLVPMKILALGGSVGTNGLLRAEIVEFRSIEQLKKASRKDVEGKIVFLSQPMEPKNIATFTSYGACYPIRGEGAVEAAKLGAAGIIIRSLAMPEDDHPHTGSLHYEEGVPQIPAAALSTNCATYLSEILKHGKAEFLFEMDCRLFADEPSYNVFAEIRGSEHPDEIITMGGHLDSWDAGEGAHDDGAGVVHCLEALRLLKEAKVRPLHTIRMVFYMNEENGNAGGITYAKQVKDAGEKQIAAVESDRGGFAPRGFECDGTAGQLSMIQQFKFLLLPYGLYYFEKGYGGVDIGPLKKQYAEIPLFGFVPDSQRYFDFHHSESDVFEAVNKRELELGCASMAAFIYLLDRSL